jgi:hypothetical protein
MSASRYLLLALVTAGLAVSPLTSALALAQESPADTKTKSNTYEAANKALDMTLNFDFEQQPLASLLDYIQRQTKVVVELDPTIGIDPMDFMISLRERNITVRAALRKALGASNLGFAIEEHGIVISDKHILLARQFGRPISVDIQQQPAAAEMRKLVRASNINFILDPRVTKQAETKVSLKLDEVPVEAVIKLLADQVDLQCVRVANVLYVTTPERAQRFLHEQPVGSMPQFFGFGFGGPFGGGFGAGIGGGFGGPGRPVPIDPPFLPPNPEPGRPVPPPVPPAPPVNPDAPVQGPGR